MPKLIITAAVTGSIGTRKDNPHIPFTPEEISNEIIRSHDAGASIAHVHVRDPKTGLPSLNIDHFREVRDRVREKCDILLNFTTSGLHVAQNEQFFEKRTSHLSLKPEICSHDIASMNFANKVSYNPPEWGSYLAKKAEKYGVKPEIEIFDSGHFSLAQQLIEKGLLRLPYFFQICFGVSGGMPGNIENFLWMTRQFPLKEVVWSTLGVGQNQFPMITLSILHGGHVRVGFEDNMYLSKGVLAKSNAELVAKAVRIGQEFGREAATPDETRKILKI